MEKENSHNESSINDDLFEEIKKFIIKERWNYDFDIDLNTTVQGDLKIYGADAAEILTKFCNKFDVSYSNFNFDKYFRPEPSWSDFLKKKKEYEDITVGDLVKAVKRGFL